MSDASSGGSPLLELRHLTAWHGESQALFGVNLSIAAGEAVALVGRNGSGRSTLARAIMGMVRTAGERRWQGASLDGLRTFEIARRGVGYVSEHRDAFPTLSVADNLALGVQPARGAARFTLDDAWRLFPVLHARRRTRAGALSGGEQQMLALARALLGNPSMIVVDEPGEGLAPQIAAQVAASLATLRERGVAMLLIEQNLAIARGVASRVAVMGHGQILFDDTLAAFDARRDLHDAWLGVG